MARCGGQAVLWRTLGIPHEPLTELDCSCIVLPAVHRRAGFFVIQPALERGHWGYALGAGMFFGLITYATYDLTNLATIKQWPIIVTVVDLLWGTVLSGSVSVIAFFAARRMGM